MRIKSFAALALMTTMLVACGGGSDSTDAPSNPGTDNPATPNPDPTPPVASAEGFWVGQASTGVKANLVVLENGETWGFYTTANNFFIGALYGNTATSGNTINVTGLDFGPDGVEAGTVSGTFTPKSALNVRTSDGLSFTAQYRTEYEQAASLSALAGTYVGTALTAQTSGESVVTTVGSDGRISAGVTGCSMLGTVVPRPSGKNIFNLSVTFTGKACALGNGAVVRGVAYYETDTRSMIALALNGSKTDGFVYLASK